MPRSAAPRTTGDVHDGAKRRFSAAFDGTSGAVLATDDGEVLMCIGPLAEAVSRVGRLITDLPDGVVSADLAEKVERLDATQLVPDTARLVTAFGLTVTARLFTLLSVDGERRYLVAVLTEEVGDDELRRLRRDGQVYELLFERAPTGIAIVRIDGTYVSANPAYCRLVGRSEQELQRMTFEDITHPDDLLLDVSLAADLLARKIDHFEIDKRYVLPDGSIAWGHLTAALLLDDVGSPLFFISMLEDITERRETQEKLQSALELWRTTFEQARVAMVEIELDGTIRRANRAAGQLMGCRPEELLGRRTIDLSDPADYDEGFANLQRFARGELKFNTSERRIRDINGRLRWLSVHTVAVPGLDGRADRLLMQVLDITEEHDLRERLRESVDDLSRAYREKVALMTALSHDLRTPLAAIRILAELVASNDEAISTDERAELAQRLLAEAARTENVLGDLVASERASAGLVTARRVPVELNDLVRTVANAELGHQTSHSLVLRLADANVAVMVDPALLERLLANLLSNTLRHTRPGSTVWVTVDDSIADHSVCIIVEDDGSGVPDSMQDAIFEPFVRGTADRPGSGIGLFLVRQFAEFHGGTVTYADREGGGASFRVTLPRA